MELRQKLNVPNQGIPSFNALIQKSNMKLVTIPFALVGETLTIPDGIEVIKGIEFDCWDGYVFMHILGYNIDIDNPKLNKLCAKNHLAATNDIIRFINHRSAKKVIKTIKEAGGIAVLAHPACCWSRDIKKTIKKLISYGLDGIETHYYYRRHRAYTKFYEPEYIKQIGDELGILQTGGSDSHSVDAIIKLED